MHRKSGHHSAQVGWYSAKDVELPLKYSVLVYAVIAHPVCSKQCQGNCQRSLDRSPEFLTGEGLANRLYWSLPVSDGSKYALVCVDTVSGLTHAFPCNHTNQAATIRGSEKLSTVYG